MEKLSLSIFSIISGLGAYASYLIPFIASSNFSEREILLITLFSSLIFLTIFIASIFERLHYFKYQIECLKNSLDIQELKIDILREENERLKP